MKMLSSATRTVHDRLARLSLMEGLSFGLRDLDKKLLKHINFRGGTFVEAGANDGLSQSNTAYFERYLGWHGLLIEPIPELAAACRKNRRRSHVHQCALIGQGDSRIELSMTYCNLMSVVDGARGSPEADAAHVASGIRHLRDDDSPRRLVVPTRTLDSIFQQEGLSHVDLLSLDVEGFEPQSLQGLNFARLAPRWILVEANDRPAVHETLQEHYSLVDELSPHDLLYRVK